MPPVNDDIAKIINIVTETIATLLNILRLLLVKIFIDSIPQKTK